MFATSLKYCLFLLLAGVLLFSAVPVTANPDLPVRGPVYAGQFYPLNKSDLTRLITALTRKAEATELTLPENRSLKALIMPHAGYIYSGWTAAHAIRALSGRTCEKVILMGPDHRIGINNCALIEASALETPLGAIPIHTDAGVLKRNSELFRPIAVSDDREHSIEVILPFLQTCLGHFAVTPVIMGRGDPAPYAAAIAPLIDENTLLVASSDLSHYLPYADAVELDRETVNLILNSDVEQFLIRRDRACGATPIAVVLILARQSGWQPVLLHYSNSGDTAGTREKVVGYAAIAFYGENNMTDSHHVNDEKGEALVRLARQTIAAQLGRGPEGKTDEAVYREGVFESRRGTFVTLTLDGQLRGCIGNLMPDKTILQGVRDNAINAAFHDPRFRPLTPLELDRIRIEVSLLSEPRKLDYTDGNDLLAKLRPHVDGIIIKKGMYSATFLPQVWEQLPDKRQFLEHLCMKAGLAPGAWQQGGLEVLTYQVQYFEEHL